MYIYICIYIYIYIYIYVHIQICSKKPTPTTFCHSRSPQFVCNQKESIHSGKTFTFTYPSIDKSKLEKDQRYAVIVLKKIKWDNVIRQLKQN